jgi:glycosyltransferase involved in cell wall biosynthesis
MMRLLFLERSLDRGGAQRQLVTLACGLAGRGHNVTVVLFYEEGPLVDELRQAEIPVQMLGKSGRWDVVAFLLRLRRVVREEKPDVLCTFLTVPNLVSIFCKILVPRLRLTWGIRASNMDLSRYDWLARLTYGVEPYLSRIADSVVANSRQGRDVALAKGFARERLKVIWNGIDINRFRPDPVGRDRVRREWRLADRTLLVGLIARLDPMKDHETFLRAASVVAKQDPDVHFVCVGDEGPIYRKDLQSFAAAQGLEGRITWSQGRDDMPAVYSACDLVCLTSTTEGFSNALAEAMACGKVCIATNVGEAEQIIGPTGRTVLPGDVAGIASNIAEVCCKIRSGDDYGRDCRERISQLFSTPVMVDAFERLFATMSRELLSTLET